MEIGAKNTQKVLRVYVFLICQWRESRVKQEEDISPTGQIVSPNGGKTQYKGAKSPVKKVEEDIVTTADNLFLPSPLTHLDTSYSPNVSCFSHIHTLPFFLQSSSHVSHQTTSSHTHDHTSIPTTFQTQTSHHSPHPSILPNFSPHTPRPLHPKSLSISIPVHPCRSSSIHKISCLYFYSSNSLSHHMLPKSISISFSNNVKSKSGQKTHRSDSVTVSLCHMSNLKRIFRLPDNLFPRMAPKPYI